MLSMGLRILNQFQSSALMRLIIEKRNALLLRNVHVINRQISLHALSRSKWTAHEFPGPGADLSEATATTDGDNMPERIISWELIVSFAHTMCIIASLIKLSSLSNHYHSSSDFNTV